MNPSKRFMTGSRIPNKELLRKIYSLALPNFHRVQRYVLEEMVNETFEQRFTSS